jgi:flagellar hook-associated protein 2
MSDLSIPGVGTSKYGSDKIVEALMKAERVPRERAATELKGYEDQKSVWLDMNQRLTSFRDDARNLYSFKNPFSSRIAKSSDDNVLTATATREALEETSSVLVKRAAAADRFISTNLAKDYKVPAGTYDFTVGDKSIELNYGGGGLQDFADSLSRKGRDLLKASVVSVTTDTKALIIESKKTGAKNRLGFSGDAEKLALAAGIMERATSKEQTLDPSKPSAWQKPIDPSAVKGGELDIAAGTEAKLPLGAKAQAQGLVLELKYRLVPLAESPAGPSAPPGPSLAPANQATYGDVTIQGAPSDTALPAWSAPQPPPRVEDKVMAFTLAPDGSSKALPALQDGDGVQTATIDLSTYGAPNGGEIAALGLRSRDTTRRLEVVSARVYDPNEKGGLRPKHAIATAQDALVSVDGVDTIRESNDISDAIPGVTLSVKAASDKPVTLKVEPDRKSVKDALISFVGTYNRIMAQINILTRSDESLVDEISYFTDDEKKSAKEHLGVLGNDSTLSFVKTSLQQTMMNSYGDGNSTIRLLAQLGISTDSAKSGSGQGYNVSKMRGYLEIDEETLDKTLASNFEGVRDLFGKDSDGDLVVDSGVAFRLDSIIKPFVETAGIISLKTDGLTKQISDDKAKIATLDTQLADKEADLKDKYATMEATLNQLESSSSSIDSFSKQGQ